VSKVLSVLGVLALTVSLCAAESGGRPPNILFILADDLGVGHVGCYGQTKINTPNIDHLAGEGMRFTQFYSGANVCAPARSTLMTGLHTGHTPVRNNGLKRYLYDEDVTVAEVLKKAGYATGGFGKWGLGTPDTPGVAVKQGFDRWFGQFSQVHAHFYYPYYLMDDLDKFPLKENEGRQRVRYSADEVHRQAMKFITEHKDGPFFAYLPYTLPHVELIVPRDSRRPYEDKFPRIERADPRPGYIGSDHAYAEFAGMVNRLDDMVGELMALLKKLGIEENTIVFFTSDNGPQPGAWKDIFVDYFSGAGPLRGAKGDYYEGGIREPMMVRWPGKIKAGSTSDFVGYFPDIMPTLAEFAGATQFLPPKIDGISFVPTLLGHADQQKKHDFLYWELCGNKQETVQQAVRKGDWKAVRIGVKAKWQLFNLAKDPNEHEDVAAKHSDVLKELKQLADASHTPERKYPAAPEEGAKDYVK